MRIQAFVTVALTAIVFPHRAGGEDEYFYYQFANQLELVESRPEISVSERLHEALKPAMAPYAVLDGPGEVYLTGEGWSRDWSDDCTVLVRRAQSGEVTGRLFVPKPDLSGMLCLRFKIPDTRRLPDSEQRFYLAKYGYYRSLAGRGLPGAPWFRQQAEAARMQIEPAARPLAFRAGGTRNALDDSFEFFAGSRAVSENLQLDRRFEVQEGGVAHIDTANVPGITVAEFDWKPLIAEKRPTLDPLAASIPADQHAVFFASFDALTQVADELDNRGTSLYRLLDQRAENELVKERYQQQLGLSMSALARLIGPRLTSSVALTGSDPYFFAGTDLALLFETEKPDALRTLLIGHATLASAKSLAADVSGKVNGLVYWARRSKNREVSSYIAALGNVVVVTNSLAQLTRLLDVAHGKTPALASLDEYTFFRDRYPRADAAETALIFISDPTIRRWCGPRWRIGDSRRTRDRAILGEIQAAHLDNLVQGVSEEAVIADNLPARLGLITLTPGGVFSSTAGTLGFQTPILEMPLDKATQREVEAYGRWREGYQRNWSGKFDPIALRVGLTKTQWNADLTIMPLIVGSQYQFMRQITRRTEIDPNLADPHQTVAELLFAIGLNDLLSPPTGLGTTITIAFDEDPFWEEFKTLDRDPPDDFWNQNLGRLPMGVSFEVGDRDQVVRSLPKLRFIVDWIVGESTREESTYRGEAFVVFRPKQERNANYRFVPLFYTLNNDALFVTFNQSVLERYIDRRLTRDLARRADKSDLFSDRAWPVLGKSAAVHANAVGLAFLRGVSSRDYRARMQLASWSNLPILNEWRMRYPNQDPRELYERYWQARLACPGGGEYVWNEKWQTMESTIYGHPGEPKAGPSHVPLLSEISRLNVGLTFEHDGLRARAIIDRAVGR